MHSAHIFAACLGPKAVKAGLRVGALKEWENPYSSRRGQTLGIRIDEALMMLYPHLVDQIGDYAAFDATPEWEWDWETLRWELRLRLSEPMVMVDCNGGEKVQDTYYVGFHLYVQESYEASAIPEKMACQEDGWELVELARRPLGKAELRLRAKEVWDRRIATGPRIYSK